MPGTWGDTEVTRTTLTVSLRGMWTVLFPSTYLWGVFLAAPLPFWSQQQGLGVSPSAPNTGVFCPQLITSRFVKGFVEKGEGGLPSGAEPAVQVGFTDLPISLLPFKHS